MSRKSLTIVRSPSKSDMGRRFELAPGTWRVLGRALSQQDATVPLTRDGDRALDADRQDMVDRAVGGGRQERARASARRGPDVDLADEKCSRTHAMVFLDKDGDLGVVDLMSTNGTRVNQQAVQEADLQQGDIIGVGQTDLQVD